MRLLCPANIGDPNTLELTQEDLKAALRLYCAHRGHVLPGELTVAALGHGHTAVQDDEFGTIHITYTS